jgi:hypothetical protein
MSDPQRSDFPQEPDDAASVDRDARIEQLLLAGLDHYFAGHYEQAINVWSRVVFLDRHHSRARAYIERARGAVAERHRESDELLHRGVDAFNRGDTGEARALINRAVEHAGPNDLALVFLERLNRLEPTGGSTEPKTPLVPPGSRAPASAVPVVRARGGWVGVAVAGIVVGAALLLAGAGLGIWFADRPATRVEAMRPVVAPLPIVRTSDMALARARQLRDDGHLRDALRTLATVDAADPLRGEADALKGDIQRHLLDLGHSAGGPEASSPKDRR